MTAIKLTKTERAMLEQAARTTRGFMHAVHGYSTSSRSGIRGTRATMAIKSLVAKGLADSLKVEAGYEANMDGWGTTHYTGFLARITDAGRKAIQQ